MSLGLGIQLGQMFVELFIFFRVNHNPSSLLVVTSGSTFLLLGPFQRLGFFLRLTFIDQFFDLFVPMDSPSSLSSCVIIVIVHPRRLHGGPHHRPRRTTQSFSSIDLIPDWIGENVIGHTDSLELCLSLLGQCRCGIVLSPAMVLFMVFGSSIGQDLTSSSKVTNPQHPSIRRGRDLQDISIQIDILSKSLDNGLPIPLGNLVVVLVVAVL